MKKKFLSLYAIWILVFGITEAAQAVSMLSGPIYFEDYPFQEYIDTDAHTLSSEVVQNASVLTSSGYGFSTSGDWDLSSASAAPLNVTVGQSSVSSVASSGFQFDNDGNPGGGRVNYFNADLHLESDINADKMASASGSYSATNFVTVDAVRGTPIVAVWDSWGWIWGNSGFQLQYSPDSDFSTMHFQLDGYVDFYNLTQSTSDLNPFFIDISFSRKDGLAVSSSGINPVVINPNSLNDPVLNFLVDYGNWDNDHGTFNENVNLGDISKISIGYNYTATIWESEPVPEPATMLLLGTGLAGLAGTRLRRKKNT